MGDTFTIEIPKDTTDSELENLQTALKGLDEVQDAGSMGARSVDAQTLMLWVQVATGVLGVISTGVPLVQKIIETIRGKGIKGVKLTLSNGTSFAADDMSAGDLEKLLKVTKES